MTALEEAIYRYFPGEVLARLYVTRDGKLALWPDDGEEA